MLWELRFMEEGRQPERFSSLPELRRALVQIYECLFYERNLIFYRDDAENWYWPAAMRIVVNPVNQKEPE